MRILFIIIISLLGVLPMGAQDYNARWKKVEEAMEKDLPQTVIAESGQIIQLAQQQGNTAEMLRATLVWMNYRGVVLPDSLLVDRKNLELQADTCQDLVDQCLLRLVLAVNTPVAQQQRLYQQALGLLDPQVFQALTQRKTTDYAPLIKKGAASTEFGHDMLSFMRQAALATMPYDLQRKVGRPVIERDEAYYLQAGNQLAAYRVAVEGVDLPIGDNLSFYTLSPRYRVLADFQLDSLLRVPSYQHENELIPALQQWISKNPRHEQVNQAKQQLKQLQQPQLSVSQASKEVYPEQMMTIRLNAYQVQQAEVCWYVLPDASNQIDTYQSLSSDQLKKKGKLVKRESLQLSPDRYVHTDSLVVISAPAETGLYRFEIHPVVCGDYPVSKAKITSQLVCVTQLMPIMVPQDAKNTEIWVVDRLTGCPVPNAHVKVFSQQEGSYQVSQDLVTNEQGFVSVGKLPYTYRIQLSRGDDFTLLTNLNTYYTGTVNSQKIRLYHNLYTDRSIYRPGQQVSYSLLSYRMEEDAAQVVKQDTVQLTLSGSRTSQNVYSSQLVTDQWGVAAGTIQLPVDLESGMYQLLTSKTQCTIRVEEYKRPTFQLEWKPVSSLYQLGDTLQLQGMATHYSGVPVQQAQVRLVTKVQQQQWWRVLAEEQVQTETLLTDVHGLFSFQLPLTLPAGMETTQQVGTYYRYTVQAVVTSPTGETHELEKSMLIGRKPFALQLDYAQLACKEKTDTWTVQLYNANFSAVSQPVELRVLRDSDGQVVWQGTQMSGSSFEPAFAKQLPGGKYMVQLNYAGEHVEYDWNLFSMEDTQPLPGSDLWLYAPSDQMDEQTPVVLQLGTSFMDGQLILHIYTELGKLETQTYALSNQLRKLALPYRTAFGKGIRLVAWMVRQGQVYRKDLTFQKTVPQKRLKVVWNSFRDCLQPGQQETWRLTFLHANGTPAKINLQTTMADASLEALAPQNWRFNLPFQRTIPQVGAIYRPTQFYYYLDFPNLHNYRITYPVYDDWGEGVQLNLTSQNVIYPRRMYSTRMNKMTVMNAAAAMNEVESAKMSDSAVEVKPEPSVRTDFRETVFFYPQLQSDAQGQVSLVFTLPESITQWHFQGLAHTTDLNYTLLDKTIQVRKKLMVQPHLPRFLRVGDRVELQVDIQNLSDKEQQGMVTMELTDSTLQQVVARYQQPVQVTVGGTQNYQFTCPVADWGSSIVCKIYAETDDFFDGEQHLLPILSDKVWLTETRAIYLNEKGQILDLSGMLNEGKGWNESSSMMVETVHNPLWVVLETLGEQAEPQSENVVDLASAYYAASVGRYLQQKYPVLAANQGLKIPEGSGANWLQQLEKLQLEDGSFAWFKGMAGSRVITRQVAELFLRLRKMGVPALDNQRYEMLVGKALTYLDKEALHTFLSASQWEKNSKQRWVPDEFSLHYLYLQELCPHALQPESQKAVDFFLDRLDRLKDNNLYFKALTCLVAGGFGKKILAQQTMQSLLEYTVETPGLGRYFDSTRSLVSWRNYRIPTQTLLIEAVDAIQPQHASAIRQKLCQWLLNQRRTQQWENSSVVMDVLYALLLSPASEIQVSTLDKGYECKVVTGTELKQMPKKWSVQRIENTDSPMSWVNVTMRTLLPLQQVQTEDQHTGLQITYQLLVDGVPVENFQVGQKVTCKMQFSVDCDMDFVQLKMEKPACLEQATAVSGYHVGQGFGYYYTPKDHAVLFYIDRLAKGTYEITTDFYVTHAGTYQSGLTSIQGVYCPEFSAHTEALQIIVK